MRYGSVWDGTQTIGSELPGGGSASIGPDGVSIAIGPTPAPAAINPLDQFSAWLQANPLLAVGGLVGVYLLVRK